MDYRQPGLQATGFPRWQFLLDTRSVKGYKCYI